MNPIIQKILEIDNFNHKVIQNQLADIFEKFGYDARKEKYIDEGGYIDLVAIRNKYTIGIEIDHSTIRWKSINKLNLLKPDLVIFILKSDKINIESNKKRIKHIKVKSILIHLPNEIVKRIN